MSQEIEREGAYRATITAYGLKEMNSGAISIGIQAHLTERYNFEEELWESWSEYDMQAEGDVWIITGKDKGNKVNQKAAESLMKFAGWDGNFDSIANGSWEATPC